MTSCWIWPVGGWRRRVSDPPRCARELTRITATSLTAAWRNRREESGASWRQCRNVLLAARKEIPVECFIGKLKYCRRVFARFDKYAKRFLAFIHFACTFLWLK